MKNFILGFLLAACTTLVVEGYSGFITYNKAEIKQAFDERDAIILKIKEELEKRNASK